MQIVEKAAAKRRPEHWSDGQARQLVTPDLAQRRRVREGRANRGGIVPPPRCARALLRLPSVSTQKHPCRGAARARSNYRPPDNWAARAAAVPRSIPASARQHNCRGGRTARFRSEEHTSELQSRLHLVCRLLLEKKQQNDAALHLATGLR